MKISTVAALAFSSHIAMVTSHLTGTNPEHAKPYLQVDLHSDGLKKRGEIFPALHVASSSPPAQTAHTHQEPAYTSLYTDIVAANLSQSSSSPTKEEDLLDWAKERFRRADRLANKVDIIPPTYLFSRTGPINRLVTLASDTPLPEHPSHENQSRSAPRDRPNDSDVPRVHALQDMIARGTVVPVQVMRNVIDPKVIKLTTSIAAAKHATIGVVLAAAHYTRRGAKGVAKQVENGAACVSTLCKKAHKRVSTHLVKSKSSSNKQASILG